MKKQTWFKTMGNPEAKHFHIQELIRIADTGIINSIDRNGRSALMLAIMAHHDDGIIISLLDKYADSTIVDSDGMTAMHLAVGFYTEHIIEKLIESGSDVHAENAKGETPLLLAASSTQYTSVIQSLIAAGAGLHGKNLLGAGVAMYAATNPNPEIMTYLEQKGVDRSVADSNGLNSLHMAIRNNVPLTLISNLLDLPLTITKQLSKKVNKKKIDYFEYKASIPSAIILASIFSSDTHVFKLLLKAGADIEERDRVFGWTPLMHAIVSSRDIVVIRYLLSVGAQINAQDPDGMTPLMLAAKYNREAEIYALLLALFADFALVNKAGMTAEQIALKNTGYGFTEYFENQAYDKEIGILFDLYANEETKNIVSPFFKLWEQEYSSEKGSHITPLMCAAEHGFEEVLSLLLGKGTDINLTSVAGLTALTFATWNNKYGCFKKLVEHGADLETRDEDGYSILDGAIIEGKIDMVKLLIEKGVPVTADIRYSKRFQIESLFGEIEDDMVFDYDDDMGCEELLRGSPPIILAIYYNSDPAIIELLIDAGSDVDESDYTFGKTAVMWAMETCSIRESRNSKVLESLISHGANLFLRDKNGKSGWVYLCENYISFDADKIFAKLPDIDVRDEDDRTLLMKLVISEPELVRLCIEAGADVNAQDDSGFTVLMSAVATTYDNSTNIKLLVEHGSDTEATFVEGFTILMLSLIGGYCDANIQALIQAGSSINATNAYLATPLMLAAVNMNACILQVLLEAGADIHARNYEDRTALMRFIEEYPEIIKRFGGLNQEIEEKTIMIVTLLVTHDPSLNLYEYLISPTFWKLINIRKRMKLDSVSLIKPFLDAGGDVNFVDPDEGITPFMLACTLCRDPNVIDWLIKKGANVNLQDNLGRSALHYLASEGRTNNIKIAKILIQAGADVNAIDNEGFSVVDLAKTWDKQGLVKILVKAGASDV